MSEDPSFAKQPEPPDQAKDSEAQVQGRPAPKKIFVFCDGTGNEFRAQAPTPEDTGGNSNVVKLYTALDLSPKQIAYYHPGVGTMGDPSKKGIERGWSKIKGLVFGSGFTDNVLDAYRYLMQHYDAGDTVYLFGFSRGAYTARALAGFLNGYGLLCRGNEGHILYAWNMYTVKLKKQRMDNDPKKTVETDKAFRDTFSHPDFIMHFVGLWDTVSSVGWIMTPLRLLHLAQNPSIVTVRHAISIDERRCFYHDNLFSAQPPQIQVPPILRGTDRGKELDRLQDLVQIWFPGVHSDVGGSYGQYSSGLANESLQWMMDQVEAAGAAFKSQRQEAVMGEPVVNDPQKLTEEIRCLYPKPWYSYIHKSLKSLWWVLEVFPHRYYNTDADPKEVLRIPWGAWRRLPDQAMLSPRAMETQGEQYKYASPNLSCGERRLIADGPWKRYGIFTAPTPKADWRQNVLLLFGVKTALTAIPVLVARPLLLWAASLASRRRCAGKHNSAAWVSKTGDFWQHRVLNPGWVSQTHAGSNHFMAAVEHSGRVVAWALLVAAAIVLFWTLVRLVKPRS